MDAGLNRVETVDLTTSLLPPLVPYQLTLTMLTADLRRIP